MTEQSPSTPAFHALAVVMRDYLSYGESGMEDLKQEVHARRRKPVIVAFCEELRQLLGNEAPVPTEVINREFRRRAEEAAEGEDAHSVEAVQYDDQQTYEALADLWEYLDLSADGEPVGAASALRAAARKQRSQMLWIDGDPVTALKAWMSWPALALFVVGVVVCTASWTAYDHVTVGFLRGILQLLTIVGFLTAAFGGGTLWLRRVRYVNPDAFLPPEGKPKNTRR